jgi:phage tail-like protein
LLPGIFQRTLSPAVPNSPLLGILAAMEELHAPAEAVLAELDKLFDANRTPDRFVTFLARWTDLAEVLGRPARTERVGAEREEPINTGIGRLRQLVQNAGYLSKWRGTRQGLIRFLEIATGMTGFEIDDISQKGFPTPFHIRVRVPAALESHRALIERIVLLERPAYVTSHLEFIKSDDRETVSQGSVP